MEEGETELCTLLTRSHILGGSVLYVTEKCTLANLVLLPPLSLQMSGTLQPCWSHSTTAFCLVDGVIEVTMFGGSADSWAGSLEKQSKLADTTSLQFCKYMSVFLLHRWQKQRSRGGICPHKNCFVGIALTKICSGY